MAIQFKELRKYLARNIRVSICFEDGHYHDYLMISDIPEEVLQDPENVDIVTDYGEYSQQEINMVSGIKRAVMFVQSHRRPMTSAELRENRSDIKNKGEDNYGYK